MSNFKICTSNYSHYYDYPTTFLTSSEQTNYIANNAILTNKAYKVWRTSGCFVINSTNDTIVFRETAGVDLTATITNLEYNSRQDYIDAVKSALEGAGVATYTVTIDANFKTVISSNLGGGATIFQIKGTNIATNGIALLGFTAGADRTGSSSYTAVNVSIHSEEFLIFNFQSAKLIQAVILKGLSGRDFGISSAGTITVMMDSANNWVTPEFSQTMDVTNFGAFLFNEDGITTAKQYMKIKIVDPANSNGYIELATFFAGAVHTFELASMQFGFQDAVEELSVVVDSIGGVRSSETRPKGSQISFRLAFATNQDKEDLEDIYALYRFHRPLFFMFDPNSTLSATPERMVRLMRFASAPSFTKENTKSWSMQMNLREEI